MSDAPGNPAPSVPVVWQRLEERLVTRIDQGLARIQAGAAAAPPDGSALLGLLVQIEVEALTIAREEMRRDGLLPTLPSGQKMCFEIARAFSDYLRQRLGMPGEAVAGGEA